MANYVDLEIGIRRDGDDYAVEIHCSYPGSDTDVRSGSSLVHFDSAELLKRSIDDTGYGKYLTEQLFPNLQQEATEQSPRDIFIAARSIAQRDEIPLRLRLFIGQNAPELHNLCWEKLCDPQTGTPLLTNEKIRFSRYLSSLDWSPVRLRRRTDLRALVVVANPELSEYPDLAQVDVQGELHRAESSLQSISTTILASEGTAVSVSEGKAAFSHIRTHLCNGYDILYLACHGTLFDGEPLLWLEDETGGVNEISGNKLVALLRRLPLRPRLVVLASCQSAGSGSETHTSDTSALAALGPRLAEACIPAVIAMQGNIAMQTVSEFMPVFFRELQRDGQIDRAMAAARSTVQDSSSDWWRPALFMRLKSGRIWYTPGFDVKEADVEIWHPLLRAIKGGRYGCYCTPILGPGLADSLFGSRREIARNWAENYQFPMAHHDREDLSQVAQYLAVQWKARALREELIDYLCKELADRYDKELLPKSLYELIKAVVNELRPEHDPLELYRILANLPFPFYITTDPTNLLEEALRSVGKEPQCKLWPWKEYMGRNYNKLDFTPSPEHPLVYYLFGSFQEPRSLVLTEDNYYDFLIGMIERKADNIPLEVLRALAENVLLFLGFRIEDRGFRVILRSIMSQEGRSDAEVSNVAAQVFPEEGYVREPEHACRYLERYFQTAQIDIYWGNVEEFIQELNRHWMKGGERS